MRAWATALLLILGVASGPALAGPPFDLSNVPDAIVLSPGTRYASNPIGGFTVHIEGSLGPVESSFVEVEISADAERLVSWCRAPYGGLAGQAHPILTGFTDANGNITFEFYGGGCLDPDRFIGATFIAQVRADGIVKDEPYIVSPDVVDWMGRRATDGPPEGGAARCDPGPDGTSMAMVSLSDAVYHAAPIKLGAKERCTKFTPPFNASVGISDAAFLTPYVKNGNVCNCQ